VLDEFMLKRKCNVSNTFIFETCDPKRVNQFIKFVSEAFKSHRILIYDLQSQNVTDTTGAPLSLSGGVFGFGVQQLLDLLKSKPTILIIRYVYDRSHADAIGDLLVAASHDDVVYRHQSTIAVFAVDSGLFPFGLLRFVYTIRVIPSTPEERRAVLESVAHKIKAGLAEKFGIDVDLAVTDDIIQASSGLTLDETESAALESFYKERKFSVPVFTEYKIKVLSEMGLQYIKPSRGFESVGGYDYLKDYVKKRIIKPLRNPEIAQKYGLGIPKGILLYGLHGCGKTWFAKTLAAEVGLPMIALNPSDFLRGIVGETESRVRQITRLMESLAPVILFIDEFDQLTLSREATSITDSGVTRRMTNMLLEWLGSEDRRTFVIGATNFVEHIDPAFLRPGRLDEVIPVLPPDMKARMEILKVHTSVIRKVPLERSDILAEIAEKTYMFTGADLERSVIEASYLAMEEGTPFVTKAHFNEAINTIEVNVEERLSMVKNVINNMLKLENVNRRFLKEALKSLSENESDTRISSLITSL